MQAIAEAVRGKVAHTQMEHPPCVRMEVFDWLEFLVEGFDWLGILIVGFDWLGILVVVFDCKRVRVGYLSLSTQGVYHLRTRCFLQAAIALALWQNQHAPPHAGGFGESKEVQFNSLVEVGLIGPSE